MSSRGCARNRFAAPARPAAVALAPWPAQRIDTPAPRTRTRHPKMPALRVLAGLRIRHDDFGIYQGNRRYADIVAGHASNAQDACIFAI
ncbi:hypothetical protein EGT41_22535 [Burkholderia cenocepacia]|uniref:Uncharacterized protein n=1 Tax=Burkholderia cenocepacia TaxID=95486 RepID=A0A3R9C4F0_9BURK|nr:hypothetical protein EGT41_22535 [Burkholderia cenocepacia]